MAPCPHSLQELHSHTSAGSLSLRGEKLGSAQLRYLAFQHELKVQGSAPGSLRSGRAIVDRELLLDIETPASVVLWLCPYLEDVADTSQLGSRQEPKCLAHGIGRAQMAAQVLQEG